MSVYTVDTEASDQGKKRRRIVSYSAQILRAPGMSLAWGQCRMHPGEELELTPLYLGSKYWILQKASKCESCLPKEQLKIQFLLIPDVRQSTVN